MTNRRAAAASGGVAIALLALAAWAWPGFLRASRPHGALIFQGQTDSGYRLFTLGVAGRASRLLPVPLDRSLAAPRYAPDGESIAFVADDATGKEDLYVARADGSDPRALAPSPGEPEGGPSWSPDSRTIVFSSHRDGNWEIYSVGVDGMALRRLTNDPGFDGGPVFSPDGKTIAFSADRGGTAGDSHIYVMGTDGSAVRKMTNGEDESAPDFSPDGRRLAFVGFTGGNADIWVGDADGSHAKRITSGSAFDYDPRWSPDGDWIAFERTQSKFPEVFLMRPDGTGLRQLTHTRVYAGAPSWRPGPH